MTAQPYDKRKGKRVKAKIREQDFFLKYRIIGLILGFRIIKGNFGEMSNERGNFGKISNGRDKFNFNLTARINLTSF